MTTDMGIYTQQNINAYKESILQGLARLDEFAEANDETVAVLQSVDATVWGLIDFRKSLQSRIAASRADEDTETQELP